MIFRLFQALSLRCRAISSVHVACRPGLPFTACSESNTIGCQYRSPPVRRVILLVVSGLSGRPPQPKLFVFFGRFFWNCSGSNHRIPISPPQHLAVVCLNVHAKPQLPENFLSKVWAGLRSNMILRSKGGGREWWSRTRSLL